MANKLSSSSGSSEIDFVLIASCSLGNFHGEVDNCSFRIKFRELCAEGWVFIDLLI